MQQTPISNEDQQRAALQRLRDHLRGTPATAQTPLELHQRGVLLQQVVDARAYCVEGISSQRGFFKELRREFPQHNLSCSLANYLIKIAQQFTAEQLAGSKASMRALLAIADEPAEHRPALLQHARTHADVLCLINRRQQPAPEPPPAAAPSQAALFDQLREAIADPRTITCYGSIKARCDDIIEQLIAAARGPERRETPRGAPEPPPASKGPARPHLRRGRDCLPVPVPFLDDDDDPGEREPSALEAEGAACVVLLREAHRTAQALCQLPFSERFPAVPAQELHLARAIHGFRATTDGFLSTLRPLAQRVEAELRAQAARAPDLAFDDLLPLPEVLLGAAEGAVPLLSYVTFQTDDPCDDPLPGPRACDALAFRLMGLLGTLSQRLPRLWTLLGEGHPIARPFYYQIYQALWAPGALLNALVARGSDDAEQARAAERARSIETAQVRERMQRDLIVLGETHLPEQYIIIGRTRDGRYVAVSAYTPQLFVTLGTQGWGKSHLAVLLAEGCALRIPGLCRLPVPPRPIWFVSDWNQGIGNHQALAGFETNPYGDQRRILRDEYLVSGSYAYEGGTLLCLPGSRERLLAMYPDLAERGLEIVEARLHESEHDQFTLSQFLHMGASSLGGRGRTQAHSFVEGVIATEGPGLTPRRLYKIIEEARIDVRSKAAFLQQLTLMDQLTTTQEHLIDRLRGEGPLIFLLESRHLTREAMLALETIFINVLSKPLRSGADPMRWMFMDELSKRAAKGKSGEALKGIGSELRHRPTSFYGTGQLVGDMPPGFLGLPTIFGQFHMGNLDEYRKVQRQVPGFRGVPFERVAALPRGVALFIAARATDPRFCEVPQEVILRPACVHAGGETLTAF